jgi:general secretion pathway protein D
VAVLRPLISANNTINANPGSNALVITDYADNLQRMAKIIAALDQPAATDVEVIPLQHAVASRHRAAGAAPGDGGGRACRAVPGVALAAGDHGAGRRAQQLADRARRQPGPPGGRAALIARLDRPGAGGGLPGDRACGWCT